VSAGEFRVEGAADDRADRPVALAGELNERVALLTIDVGAYENSILRFAHLSSPNKT